MWQKFALCALLVSGTAVAELQIIMDENLKKLEQDNALVKALSERIAKYYYLDAGETLRDITADILASKGLSQARREAIKAMGRHIYVFEYPSGGYKIKGYVSFILDGQPHPLLVNLRGGNALFGIQFPGDDLACARDYTVISTTYRGGVSEGVDEYGGNDVEDVKNLVDYIPELERKLQTRLNSDKFYMLGGSRGGMQLFLALTRYPELQQRALKVVFLSGLLDMRETLRSRPDLKEMFAEEYGYREQENGEEWINWRDPMLAVDKLRKDLPVYIIQTTGDIRVDLVEGYNMVRKLEEHGNPVTYLEVSGADHCLYGSKDRVDIILNWLEK